MVDDEVMPDEEEDICPCCNGEIDTFHEYVHAVREKVAEYGWMAQGVIANENQPGWLYTIGLAAVGHPEIIIVGLPPKVAHSLLAQMADEILSNQKRFEPGPEYSGYLADGFKVTFLDVADVGEGDWFNIAHSYYGDHDFEALQMVWPDKEGHFPWDPQYDVRYHQCLVGEP